MWVNDDNTPNDDENIALNRRNIIDFFIENNEQDDEYFKIVNQWRYIRDWTSDENEIHENMERNRYRGSNRYRGKRNKRRRSGGSRWRGGYRERVKIEEEINIGKVKYIRMK